MISASVLLDRLKALHPKMIDLSLARMHRILAALGNPEARLPPVIHVAGTNGKGSLVAYLRAMFEAAGYRAHVYTSPHLVRFNERIVIAGQPIDEIDLARILAHCERVNEDQPITLFEITTAAALLAFADYKADVLLLEVGLGGRLDATNVVDQPLLTAITPVSLDHQHYLGDTVAEIAFEKAGILKTGIPAIIGRQDDIGGGVIAARAHEIAAPLHRLGHEWNLDVASDGFRYRDASGELIMPRPGLAGPHQYDNAATAVACARLLNQHFTLTPDAMATGLRNVDWPARLQRLTSGTLPAMLMDGQELWLDGGHNASAGLALAEAVKSWGDKRLDLVFGMLETKDPAEFLRPIAPYIGRLRTLEVPGDTPGIPAEPLAAIARSLGIEAEPGNDITSAIGTLSQMATAPTRILICGSLYLAGAVLALNGD